MTIDENEAYITNELSGRTIEMVIRNGKILELQCTDGHVIKLQADVNGDIRYHSTGVRVYLQSLLIEPVQGML